MQDALKFLLLLEMGVWSSFQASNLTLARGGSVRLHAQAYNDLNTQIRVLEMTYEYAGHCF